MGLFGRKNTGEVSEVAPPPPASAIPDYGYNQEPSAPPKTVSDIPRTTSYPQGAEGFARNVAKEKTTSYRQQSQWARRNYDTIN